MQFGATNAQQFAKGKVAGIAPLPANLRASRMTLWKDLEVKRYASEDASKEQPATNSEGLSATERSLSEKFRSKASNLRSLAQSAVSYARDTIENLKPSRIDVSSRCQAASVRLEEALAEELSVYEKASFTAKEKDKAYKRFRVDHERTEDPSYNDNKLSTTGIIFAVIVVESAMNAFIFAQASDQGLVGGLSMAIIPSVVNALCLGFGLIGFLGWRNAIHVNRLRQVLGWSAINLGLSFAILFNLLMAHYRDALEASPDADWRQALEAFLSRWWAFDSLEAVALFIIGMMVCALGAWKGHSGYWDTYFNYAKVHRAKRDAEADRDEARARIREIATDVVEAELDDCRATLAESEESIALAKSLRRDATERLQDVTNSSIALRNEASRLLILYRQTNEHLRETAPPAHFQVSEAFEIEEVSAKEVTLALESLEEAIESNVKAYRELEAQLVELSAKRLKDIEKTIEEYRRRGEDAADRDDEDRQNTPRSKK